MTEALKLSDGFNEMKDPIKEKVKTELNNLNNKIKDSLSQKNQQQMRFFLNYKIKN